MTRGIATRLHAALVHANASLFATWQIDGQAGRHPDHRVMADGAMTPTSYAAMHAWRHVRPGAVRVDVVSPVDPALLVSAYVHDERGEAVTILINGGKEPREVLLNWGRAAPENWRGWITAAAQSHVPFAIEEQRGMARLELPGHSIVTTVADWDRARVESPVAPRWAREIAAIERREAERPVPENGILFVGSSSIRM